MTVKSNGNSVDKLPDRVKLRNCVTHLDDRGSLFEGFDRRWDWNPEPVESVYFVAVRPSAIKGWVRHYTYSDRMIIVSGELEVVLYDERPNSPTNGLLSKFVLSHFNRQILYIPPYVWHLVQNIGQTDVLFANLPTKPYDHENPDKYRLPLDTDRIPYKVNDLGSRKNNATEWK